MPEASGIGMALEIAATEVEREKAHLSDASTAAGGDISGPKVEPKHNGYSNIYIMTDSRVMLEFIDKYLKGNIRATNARAAKWFGHPAWKELVRQLERIDVRDAKVEFHWIKGHSVSKGNMLADTLAKKARNRYRKEHGQPDANQEYKVVRLAADITGQFIRRKHPNKRKAGAMLQDSTREPDEAMDGGHDIAQRVILEPKRTISKPVSTSDAQVPEPTPDSTLQKDLEDDQDLEPKGTVNKPVSASDNQILEPIRDSTKDPEDKDGEKNETPVPRKKPRLE
ncbi:hypothetical protein SLS62_009671 [Diatrype stigma]|uniref:RNase H type-1 domain-containing protein n=1 Tax=Diatrype stigma TaxID=117547 RepID=A0AAN9UFV9_9PEZI